MDGQTELRPQDRASIAVSRGKNEHGIILTHPVCDMLLHGVTLLDLISGRCWIVRAHI